VVPNQVIDALLRSMGIEPGDGVSPDLLKGGFNAVRREVKRVGREGWSAGQVLEQVGPCRRSIVNRQSSIVNRQSSIVNRQVDRQSTSQFGYFRSVVGVGLTKMC
jgi:hypothetical protein